MSYLPEKPTTLSHEVRMAEPEVHGVVCAEAGAQRRHAGVGPARCADEGHDLRRRGNGRTGRAGAAGPPGAWTRVQASPSMLSTQTTWIVPASMWSATAPTSPKSSFW